LAAGRSCGCETSEKAVGFEGIMLYFEEDGNMWQGRVFKSGESGKGWAG